MAAYWLTFRLHEDSTYAHRYEKLIETIENAQSMWWTESSSFILFECDLGIDDLALAIKQVINPSTDIILIGMPDFKSARAIGAIKDQDLFKLMPFTKKV